MRRTSAIAALSALVFLSTAATASAAGTDGPAHALAMHGKPKYPADFKHFDYVNPSAPKGGTQVQGVVGTFDSLNNFIIQGNPAAGLGLIYDSLMESAADEPFTQYCLICETIDVPDDRSWVEFTLREDARWHDGKPITVDDVIFTLNVLREKGNPFFRFYYGDITSVSQTGPRKVKFAFGGTPNPELPLIIGQLAILPKHYWESRDFSKTTREEPLGSGPYRPAGSLDVKAERGHPPQHPPWGTLTGIDLPAGALRWQVPLGAFPELREQGLRNTGTPNYGGPILTASGLLFIAASADETIRAFDKHTGEVLWQAPLPASGFATPITYAAGGRQFVVVAAGGGKLGRPSGSSFVAFALPEE